jgi:hypothetical protein
MNWLKSPTGLVLSAASFLAFVFVFALVQCLSRAIPFTASFISVLILDAVVAALACWALILVVTLKGIRKKAIAAAALPLCLLTASICLAGWHENLYSHVNIHCVDSSTGRGIDKVMVVRVMSESCSWSAGIEGKEEDVIRACRMAAAYALPNELPRIKSEHGGASIHYFLLTAQSRLVTTDYLVLSPGFRPTFVPSYAKNYGHESTFELEMIPETALIDWQVLLSQQMVRLEPKYIDNLLADEPMDIEKMLSEDEIRTITAFMAHQ